jgi:hypothetical protein
LFFNSALFPAWWVMIMNCELIGIGEDVAYCKLSDWSWRLTAMLPAERRDGLPSASQHCWWAEGNSHLKCRHTKLEFYVSYKSTWNVTLHC